MRNTVTNSITRALLVGTGLALAACFTSQESAVEVDRGTMPTEINSDADRQAAYNSNTGYGGSVPDATPGRVRLGEQASGTNSRKRPESLNNTNDPNNTTPETRLRRLNDAPTDTLRRP